MPTMPGPRARTVLQLPMILAHIKAWTRFDLGLDRIYSAFKWWSLKMCSAANVGV